MKLFLLALFVAATLAFSVEYEHFKPLWNTWKVQHNKFYSTSEEAARYAIFIDNVNKIKKLNEENDGVEFALNKFADLTATEFKQIYASSGFFNLPSSDEEYLEFDPSKPLPNDVDWRTKGVVTPVKNQGQCGSCWTFSATGVLESYHAIQTGTLLSFSEQQIVDCATSAGYGCEGGWPDLAVDYAGQAGLESESDYPYTGEDGTCQYNKKEATVVNKGHAAVTPKSVTALQSALNTMPVSIAIEADQNVFQFYKSGVISKNCGDSLDHAVLAVGYGTFSGAAAFIVKNSWGTDWGNQGYVYLGASGTPNAGAGVCGILSTPIVPN